MPSTPSTAGAAQVTATPSSTPAPSFTSFVLERVSRNPLLINETPRSVSPPSQQTAAATSLSPAQHLAKSAHDPAEEVPSIPSTLDAAQRAVITQASISGNAAALSPASASAATAVLQRVLIDVPLLPVGGCHLLPEMIWLYFIASAAAAKQLSSYRKALQLYDARQAPPSTGETAPLQGRQPHRTEATASTSDGEPPKETAAAAVDVFAASPLASSPADDQQHSDSGADASSSTGTACLLKTPEELSLSCTRDALQANMEQARVRLAGSRRELDRGLKKLRQILDSLRAYDAVPLAALQRQRQEAMRTLFTPVVVAPAGAWARDDANVCSDSAVLATNAAAAVSRGAPGVLGSASAVADRKRSREA
ncbi:hypothetical protein LSCM1_07442 [Leishmania martiniquensis]|uniref:Uncharacterized protein n=1 Tax=Leishmania martiniquensis TaxID=1580590 RepID=A0A836HJQ8_9TRYP|nr:hypothetical protein LSCM1_07442 [Leishmania martiniquensis]